MEKLLRESHGTDINAHGLGYTSLVTTDEFRTATANVDNQQFLLLKGKSPLNCQKGISSLLIARYDANIEPELLLEPCAHFGAVPGISESTGAHRDNFFDVEALTTFQIPLQNLKTSLFSFWIDGASLVDTLS